MSITRFCASCGAPMPHDFHACPGGGALALPEGGTLDPGAAPVCLLTEADVRLLEQAADINGGPASTIGRAVAGKIRSPATRLCEETPPAHATLGSRVVFRVNGGDPMARVLVHWDRFFVPGLDLSLATPWGIALIGLKEGHEAIACWRDGTAERITLDSVRHQAAPGRTESRAPGERIEPAAGGNVLRLEPRRRPAAPPPAPAGGLDRDPPPPAA